MHRHIDVKTYKCSLAAKQSRNCKKCSWVVNSYYICIPVINLCVDNFFFREKKIIKISSSLQTFFKNSLFSVDKHQAKYMLEIKYTCTRVFDCFLLKKKMKIKSCFLLLFSGSFGSYLPQ